MSEHRTWSKKELDEEKSYFTFKRNRALEHFNKRIKDGNDATEAYESLMRIQKQWILIDDALVIHELKHDRRK